ncbi:hypothetical protein KIS1582_1262 [Cytobacillus firmus]|uniref:Uncharacterized protein n=1 Tax=Cytobacillus firmus TaxID=1399 RepID=A0A800NBS3_CYTFI|nr:hypothetical protein KIS1582_1262 [Cytobacillus firmus]
MGRFSFPYIPVSILLTYLSIDNIVLTHTL